MPKNRPLGSSWNFDENLPDLNLRFYNWFSTIVPGNFIISPHDGEVYKVLDVKVGGLPFYKDKISSAWMQRSYITCENVFPDNKGKRIILQAFLIENKYESIGPFKSFREAMMVHNERNNPKSAKQQSMEKQSFMNFIIGGAARAAGGAALRSTAARAAASAAARAAARTAGGAAARTAGGAAAGAAARAAGAAARTAGAGAAAGGLKSTVARGLKDVVTKYLPIGSALLDPDTTRLDKAVEGGVGVVGNKVKQLYQESKGKYTDPLPQMLNTQTPGKR